MDRRSRAALALWGVCVGWVPALPGAALAGPVPAAPPKAADADATWQDVAVVEALLRDVEAMLARADRKGLARVDRRVTHLLRPATHHPKNAEELRKERIRRNALDAGRPIPEVLADAAREWAGYRDRKDLGGLMVRRMFLKQLLTLAEPARLDAGRPPPSRGTPPRVPNGKPGPLPFEDALK